MPKANSIGANKISNRRLHAGQSEKAALNRAIALELRAQRWGFREIAKKLGVSVSTAHAYVEEAWGEVRSATADDIENLRQIELEILDRVEKALLPVATRAGAGDRTLAAIDRLIRVQERRAKLLGLNAPDKVEHSGEIRHLTLSEFRARAKLARA